MASEPGLVAKLEDPEGVIIGAGLLALWWLCSLVLLVVLVARDVVLGAFRAIRWRFANRDAKPSG